MRCPRVSRRTQWAGYQNAWSASTCLSPAGPHLWRRWVRSLGLWFGPLCVHSQWNGLESLERWWKVCCPPTQEKGVGKCVPLTGSHYPQALDPPLSLTKPLSRGYVWKPLAHVRNRAKQHAWKSLKALLRSKGGRKEGNSNNNPFGSPLNKVGGVLSYCRPPGKVIFAHRSRSVP